MRTEEAVELLGRILRHSRVAITVADRNGRLTEFNAAAEQLTGYRKEEVLGKPVSFFYESTERLREILDVLWREGKAEERELTLLGKEGRRVPVSITVAQFYGREGEPLGSVGITVDLTDRHRLEDRLREARTWVEYCTNLVMHDLRNYSQIVGGYLEALLAGQLGPLTDDQRRVLQICHRQTVRSQILFGQLRLLLERASGAEATAEPPTRYLLETVLAEAAVSLHELYPERPPRIRIEVTEGAAVLAGPHLPTLVLNLLVHGIEENPVESPRLDLTVRSSSLGSRPAWQLAIVDDAPRRSTSPDPGALRPSGDPTSFGATLRWPLIRWLVERDQGQCSDSPGGPGEGGTGNEVLVVLPAAEEQRP
jgi:PAS domain S-box-containing protein